MNLFAAHLKACGLIFLQMRSRGTNMKSSIPLVAVLCVAGVFIGSRRSQAQDPADAHLAVMKQYCASCHSEKLKTGGVSFEGITSASIPKDPELFEKAVRKLRGRVVPP